MGQIPDSVIEEVLQKADIESVVGKYVSFTKRTGSNLFGLCPFHSEKTASFSVSLNKQIYHCFGCNKGGNAIGFIMDIEHLSYPEAIRFLGKQYGVDVPETSFVNNDAVKSQKERVKLLLVEAAKFFYKALKSKNGDSARQYMDKRGLSKETQIKFGLGYSLDDYDSLYLYLKQKGFTDEEMKVCGLFTVSSKTGKLIDLFRGRLMFPIFDAFGAVIAFGGRSLGDDMPKYINSPDSAVYKKQEHLYALNFAKKERSDRLIIVEGYMDAIAMHQAGVRNAVASLGTAFTDAQLRLASKYAKEIVFFFDADKAGQNAALRAISMMLRYTKKMTGLKARIRIACVPDGKDPDEYIREHGSEAFTAVVEAALDVDRYLSDRAYNSNYSDNGLDLYKYEEDIITYGSWMVDDVKRNRMASNAALYLKANPDVIFERMNDAAGKLSDVQAQADERLEKKVIDEKVTSRKESSQRQASENDDIAYLEELKLFALATRLKKALADPEVIAREDLIRKGDFVGTNLKNIVGFFFDNFDPKFGTNDALLINEMSKYTLNGQPAEQVFLEVSQSIDDDLSFETIKGMYLYQLVQIRRNYLLKARKEAISMLDSVTGEQKASLSEKIKQMDACLDMLREKELSL